MTHLLVTNDFPPKVGGIQNYLWELWRRLPPDSFSVLTTVHPGDAAFDASQPFRVERVPRTVLWPSGHLKRRIQRLAGETGSALVVLDPVLPLGALGPRLGRPYAVVAHGAEITVPGRLPVSRAPVGRVLRRAAGAVAAGSWVASEVQRAAGRDLDLAVVPPGVDTQRFRPLEEPARQAARRQFGLPDGPLVVNVGRLVPRKGADVLIDAAARVSRDFSGLTVAVAGTGRDRERLEERARRQRAPVRFLGSVPDDLLADLYACADVFAAPNRTRWGGLEQEGFGIVFLEAAACAVPQVAGNSGGAPEAVADGETGLVVDHPEDPRGVAEALGRLLGDPHLRARMGAEARRRAVDRFSYDTLAAGLASYLARLEAAAAASRP
ncbi:MAG TPA: glycosyltransferase family 4 protein [Actinomycetota bacterium]|nr:glycosyltransferase family 4 protein [Actinomycetota bacterium]